jgi:biopolymer transport protein ExbD
MSDQPKRFFDLWFVQANNVVKEVPFHVVTDWCQQGRAVPDDRIKPSGTSEWYPLGSVVAFQPYFPQPERRPQDAAEAMAPVEMDIEWPNKPDDGDEDVDMIPLIDISLVLLIFFMMTMVVAAVSRISVPEMANAITIETNPGIIRLDIDQKDGRPVYALGLGTAEPAPEDANLTSDVELFTRLDDRLRVVTEPPKVRIAAHGDIPYEVVEEVLKGLERRQQKNPPLIRDYAVEVNERAKP